MSSSRSPRACLSDMPWHIKQRIVGFTDPVTRLFIRKVSTDLRYFVDHSPSRNHFTSISVAFDRCLVVLRLTHQQAKEPFFIEYLKSSRAYTKQKSFNHRQVGGRFEPAEQVVMDLATVFKNPNSSVGHLTLPSNDRITRHSMRAFAKDKDLFLKTFQQEFSQVRPTIQGINIGWPMSQDEMLSIFRCLKPITLEWIMFEPTSDNTMEQIVETEQYRNLDRLAVRNVPLGNLLRGKIGKVTNVHNTTASLEEMKSLLSALLHKEDTDSLNYFLRNVNYDEDAFLDHLFDDYGVIPTGVGNQYVVKKPDCNDYIVILHKPNDICFFGVNDTLGEDLLAGDFVDYDF